MSEMNENGELFADFRAINSLVIGGTISPNKSKIGIDNRRYGKPN